MATVGEFTTYEERLNSDPRWALNEGSRHFDRHNAVFTSLERLARRLDSLGIPYAAVGGMALFHHGFRRFTEDVHLLVTRENLVRIHQELEGLEYVRPHANSKHLRAA